MTRRGLFGIFGAAAAVAAKPTKKKITDAEAMKRNPPVIKGRRLNTMGPPYYPGKVFFVEIEDADQFTMAWECSAESIENDKFGCFRKERKK